MRPKKYDRDASTLRVAEMRDLCVQLGIIDNVKKTYAKTVKNADGNPKEKTTKRAYLTALQQYFLHDMYGTEIPKSMRDAFVYRPMLATKTKKLTALYENAWMSTGWTMEEKIRGYRLSLSVSSVKATSFSRFLSDTNFLPIEHPVPHKRILLEAVHASAARSNLVLDVELTAKDEDVLVDALVAEGYIVSDAYDPIDILMSIPDEDQLKIMNQNVVEYVVLDVLEMGSFKGTEETLEERLKKRKEITEFLRLYNSTLNGIFREPKVAPVTSDLFASRKRFYKEMKDLGKEGVISKKLDELYVPKSRSEYWLKFKFLTNAAEMDTIDAFVTDLLEKDMVKIAVYGAGKLATHIDVESLGSVRIPGGSSVVKVDDVVEVERTEEGLKFVRLRPFKKQEECVLIC